MAKQYAVDNNYQDVPSPTPIKMYMNGEFVIIFYLENKMHFNKGKYALKDGKATETILASSTESLIGEKVSFKPNFRLDFTKILIPLGLLIIFVINPLLKIIPLNISIFVNS